MKTIIVSPCGLPIPAVKGGAVLTLIESIIIQNEINKKMELTVIGVHDKEAVEKSKKYKNTNFIFIKEPKICKIIDNLYEKIYIKLSHKQHNTLKRYLWKLYVISYLKKILKKFDFDKVVLENSGYLLNILKDRNIAKKYDNKIFYHLHNDIPDNIYINELKKCKILSISEYLTKKIISVCGNEIEKNIFILKNGFNCEKFNKELTKDEKIELKEKLQIEKDKKIILFAGRITPEKGIKELLEAYEKIDNDNVVLLIVGSHNFGANNTSNFEQNIKTKFESLKEKIKFTGYIDYDDMWKYYKLADVAVFPSTWEEPAGLTMLEATVAKIPVITTISGGIPEYLLTDYATMFHIDDEIVNNIKNSIIEILENKEKYIERAIKASKYIGEKYTEENLYNNFLELLYK